MRLGIIFGSKGTEREVSLVSASNIIKNLNKEKYDISLIYLDKSNNWFLVKDFKVSKLGDEVGSIEPLNDVISYLKSFDVVFPVLHGKFGEDGTIQGMLELLGIPYVGCGILASSIALDKVYTKILLSNHLNVVEDIVIKKENNKLYLYDKGKKTAEASINEIDLLIKDTFNYPVFVKPSRFGSSIGVKKVNDTTKLKEAIDDALCYDNEILIERLVVGRELECAILNGKALSVGEVKSAEEFYSFDAKYKNDESKTIIPANIDNDIYLKIKSCAEDAFSIINGRGLARVDFFLENETNKLYINEINTMPGFTEISMYPMLVKASGIKYDELLDILIENAKTDLN